MQKTVEESEQLTLAFILMLSCAVLRRHNRSVEARSKQLPSWTGVAEGCTFHAHLLKPCTSPGV